MPLPIAHTLISTSVFVAYRGGFSLKDDWRWAALFAFAGLLPDIDFVTVPFLGFGAHRGFTHSFLFAFLATALIYIFISIWRSKTTPRLWAFLFMAMALHPICDYFTYDYLVERGGVKLFYPFSNEYYESPLPIFMGIELRHLKTIFSLHTLAAVAYETVLSGALLLTTLYLKRTFFSTGRRAEQ
ncbi:MAG: metal-dependent hydrolase [Deltaproteobacteria bacterium]|nr:metal-dependent hydrolase [Deltaproteobacteria bacterium]